MKRLHLEDFKIQKSSPSSTSEADRLLGQVLGNCHDGPTHGTIGEGDDDEDPIIQ